MLKEYRQKRNFERTPEPDQNQLKSSGSMLYVIQEHHASHLHYDFRVELNGVLKSWALPKGMPTAPGERRLAIATEDHPLEYANFEGIIPKGEYGAGIVKIYDKGLYENLTVNAKHKQVTVACALQQGHFSFCLQGERFKNVAFVLQRFKTDIKPKPYWLIIKKK